MNERFDDEPLLDSREEVPIGAFEIPQAPHAIRDTTWQVTSAHLRRRRVFGQAFRASAAAALFVCGIGVGLLVARDGGQAPSSTESPLAHVAEATSDEANDDFLSDTEAFALRLKSAPTPERVALLRGAGDRYLNELGDVRLALHCYQRMLDIADAEQVLSLDANDTWLLMALKLGRQQEIHHDKPSA